MSNVFRNALVLSETVVGSIIDTRALVLYEQPEDVKFGSDAETTIDEDGNIIETGLLQLVDSRKLKEIFTGFADEKYTRISKINGWNAYGVSYIKADVDITSDLCDFPIETGSIITDNAIVQPITIKVQIALPTAFATRIYAEMIKYYQKKKYIMVQTKFAMYRNMVIQSMPFKLENETIDRPIVELTLRQVVEVEPQYINIGNGDSEIKNPKDASDSDTVDIGRTQSHSVVASLENQAQAMEGFGG
jgi:hypothetical protein